MINFVKNFMRHMIFAETGKVCPRCNSTNTDLKNGIWYCNDCRHEW